MHRIGLASQASSLPAYVSRSFKLNSSQRAPARPELPRARAVPTLAPGGTGGRCDAANGSASGAGGGSVREDDARAATVGSDGALAAAHEEARGADART